MEEGAWAVLRTTAAEGVIPPKARGGHTAVLVEKNLIVQGGQQHKSAGTFEYFTLNPTVLDTETHTWFTPRVALGKGPIERAFHSTTRVGSGLYTFGGQTAKVAGESGLLGDLIIFDLHRMCWDTKDVRGKKPRSRFMHSAELCEGKLFIYGGSDGTRSLSDVSILDIGTNLWSSPICTGSVPPGLQAHTCTIVGERLFVVGGMSISLDDAGHSFIKCARTSTALSPSPFHLFTHSPLPLASLRFALSNRLERRPHPRLENDGMVAANTARRAAQTARLPLCGRRRQLPCGHGRLVGAGKAQREAAAAAHQAKPSPAAPQHAFSHRSHTYLSPCASQCENLASLSTLDLDGLGTWASVAVPGQPPAGNYGHTATVLGSNILVFGGWDGVSPLSAVNVLDTTKL